MITPASFALALVLLARADDPAPAGDAPAAPAPVTDAAAAPPSAPDAPPPAPATTPPGPAPAAPTAKATTASPAAPAAATAAATTSTTATRPRNVVSLNVPSNVFGAYSLEYERVFTNHVGMFVEPTFFNIAAQAGFSPGIRGPGLVAGAKLYPFGEAPDGLFLAPELYLAYLDSLADSGVADLGLGTGAVAGWSWRFWEHLHVSLGLGGTVNVLGMSLAGTQGFGFMPVIRANVGGAF